MASESAGLGRRYRAAAAQRPFQGSRSTHASAGRWRRRASGPACLHDDEVDGRGEEASEAVHVRSILHRARLLEATSATEKSLAEVHRYLWQRSSLSDVHRSRPGKYQTHLNP